MERAPFADRPLTRWLLTAGLLFALLASRVPAASSAAQTPRDIASGRVIVTLQSDADPTVIANRAIRQNNAAVRQVYQTAIRGFAATLSPAAAQALARDPAVRSITPDYPVQATAQTLPTGVDRIDADKNLTASIDGIDTPINVDIAILDSGITAHGDLNVVGGIDCTGTGSYVDDNGHGTHVAGSAAARDNASGVVGVAPGARVWAVKVLTANASGSYSTLICGVDWVTRNAGTIAIANMSLAGTAPASTCTADLLSTDPFHQAICRSVNAGVTYTVAAGNAAANASGYVPASFDEVITVSAASDQDGKPGGDSFASFSNYGSVVDIAAPGVGILSTLNNGSYGTKNGTSMASPHVAGAAALIIATNGRIGPASVKSLLLSSREHSALTGDPDGISEGILAVGNGFALTTPTQTPTATATKAATTTATATKAATTTATATALPATATPTATPSSGSTNGSKVTIVGATRSSGSTSPTYAYDGNTTTSWYTSTSTTPTSAHITLDTGATRSLSSIRWQFRVSGYADRMYIQVSNTGTSWSTLARRSNATAGTWQSVATTTSARYVRFYFTNPNSDPRLGYLAEIEIYAATSAQVVGSENPTTTESAPVSPTVSSTATPPLTVASGGAVTIANTGGAGANCRVGPSVEASVIATLAEGTVLESTGPSVDGWQPVTCTGQSGFVSVLFLASAAALPVATAASAEHPTPTSVEATVTPPPPDPSAIAPGRVATDVAVEPVATLTPTPSGPTPFPVAVITGSANTNLATDAVDGDRTTIWRAETGLVEDGATLTLDLGVVQPVGTLRWVTPLTGPSGGLTFHVSEDGERWMTVGQPEWWDVDTRWREWEVNVAARFVRFTFANRDGRPVLGGLAEVEVHAATSPLRPLALDTPTPIPAPTLTAVEPTLTITTPADTVPLPSAPPETPATDEPPVPPDPPATNEPNPALGG
ncbi:MAG: hypothetical protein AVDCRST_MAG70-382 [uncultured Thermomicrobiales bacterium]|uniref:F5/8 type C domain-containing protein n=1 Tax=uncultured Thermomicrobiales bacterium TaxID=1645740 RepID=A0A6J4U9Y5_9BACT|nr:MAG: hypothetical protein AVDCRST_MAG70-382 [uncultured Thermomicrobiales bacterium]